MAWMSSPMRKKINQWYCCENELSRARCNSIFLWRFWDRPYISIADRSEHCIRPCVKLVVNMQPMCNRPVCMRTVATTYQTAKNRQPTTCHKTLPLDPVCVRLNCLFTYLQRQENLMEWKIVRGDNNNLMSSESHAGSTRQSINESQPLFGGRMCMRVCFLRELALIIRYDLDRTFDTTYAD